LFQKTLFGWKKFAAVRIRVAKLPFMGGHVEHRLDIYKDSGFQQLLNSSIGSMVLDFSFNGAQLDMHTIPSLLQSENSDDPILSSTSDIVINDDVNELMTYFEKAGLESEDTPLPTIDSSRFTRFFHRSASEENITTKLTSRPGKVLSHRTKHGLKELSELASSFFKTGWNMSKIDLVKSLSFVHTYYSKYNAQTRTHSIIISPSTLKIALYWLNFSVAAYGSIVINWCGHGNGFVLDQLKSKANKRAAAKHLNIELSDILVWEFDGNEMFKPSFFISRDASTNSIVISVRGTWVCTLLDN